ncbi:Telomeric repeat-binding factor 2 [Sesbania bispinosa]|nr:Telomeric repeat-binding factor 2 [Sesbania bispinosa]
MENLDRDISGWIMEFLLRSSAPDSLLQKTLTALPLSGADSRLKKTILLRILQSEILRGSLSETALQILELLDELDRNDAVPVSDSMRRAYCAVAVECTVKYLIHSPRRALRRILRRRPRSGAAESSAYGGGSTERAGLRRVGAAYLKEAWEIMGPFVSLDSGAMMMSKAKALRPEVMAKNQGKEQMKERIGASVETTIQKNNLQLRRKHSALRACHRGVRISGSEEVEPEKSLSKYDDPLPSAEAEKVRKSLKSSSLELRAMVKDPLPDALHTSEVVRSNLATKDINLEPPIENRSGDVDVPDQDVCKSIVLYQPNDANLGKKSPVNCSNVHHPSLMKRKSTARTCEWVDSIDNLPRGTQPRRRKRKWSTLEEEKLRDGCKNVDLKDKWRNMIR